MSLIGQEEQKSIENAKVEDYITKDAILFETRLSRNIPKFQYKVLNDDPQIIQLRNMVETKLRKKDIVFSEDGSANLKTAAPAAAKVEVKAAAKDVEMK